MIPKCIIMPKYDEAEMGKAISASILENSRGVDVGADALHDHLQSHQIAATLQDDDVGKFAAWLHIPQSTAEDADVGIRLHKDRRPHSAQRFQCP